MALVRPHSVFRFGEALGSPGSLVHDPTADPDEYRWRRVGQSPLSLPPIVRDRALRIGAYLYLFNPLAHRMVEMLRGFVIGQGWDVDAADPRTRRYLRDFWDRNRLGRDWLARYALGLSVLGEAFIPVHSDGKRLLLGYVSPLSVVEVVGDQFSPGIAREVRLASASGEPEVALPVLNYFDREGLSPSRGFLGVFHWAVNNLPDDPRGLSDLFVLADALEQFDRTIWARQRRAELEGSYIWDITIKGATEQTIHRFEKELLTNPPAPGSFRVHNEAVSWQAVQPSSGGRDVSQELQFIRSNIAAAFGIPDFFITGESGPGRMATTELWGTVINTAGDRQRELKLYVSQMLDFALSYGKAAGVLPRSAPEEYQIIAPVVGIRDVQRLGGALARLGEFFLGLNERGIVDDETVRSTLVKLLRDLGIEVKLPQ